MIMTAFQLTIIVVDSINDRWVISFRDGKFDKRVCDNSNIFIVDIRSLYVEKCISSAHVINRGEHSKTYLAIHFKSRNFQISRLI